MAWNMAEMPSVLHLLFRVYEEAEEEKGVHVAAPVTPHIFS